MMVRWIALLGAAAAVVTAQPQPEKVAKAQTLVLEFSAKLKQTKVTPDLQADVGIYLKAADWILRHPEEFFRPASNDQLIAVLEKGLARVAEVQSGALSWPKQKGRLSRGYISRIDGSVQPYGLVIPESYDPAKPTRLDVVLHGRADTQNEVNFLFAHDAAKPIPPAQQHLVLEVYGRGNNAYRWAGEADVFEAVESVRSRYNVDPNRIVLRGFSMGGAGAWHIGLHYPDQWVAIEAGAGFAETRTYAKLPPLRPSTNCAPFTSTMPPITPRTLPTCRLSATAVNSTRSAPLASSFRNPSPGCRTSSRYSSSARKRSTGGIPTA